MSVDQPPPSPPPGLGGPRPPGAPEPDVAPPAVDSYRRAADAMRDATKWMTAFVPGAGLVLALAALLPDLADKDADDPAFWWALGLIAVSALAASVAIALGARALVVKMAGFGDAIEQASTGAGVNPALAKSGTLIYDLDRDAVLRLYGYRNASVFFKQLAGPGTPRVDTVVAGTLVLDYANYRETRDRFRAFLIWGGLALALTAACLGGASYAIARAGPAESTVEVTAPTPVTLELTPAGVRRFERTLDCAPTKPIAAFAVGGRLDEPEIVIADDACATERLSWDNRWGVVVPAP